MVMINLLPWRPYERRYQIKMIFLSLLFAFLFSSLLILAINSYLHMRLRTLSITEFSLQDDLEKLNIQVNHNEMQGILKQKSKFGLAKEIAQAELRSIELFSLLGKSFPQRVCLTQLKQKDNTFYFIGRAFSIYDLTDFLQNWAIRELFTEIKIQKIITKHGMVEFKLQAVNQAPSISFLQHTQ